MALASILAAIQAYRYLAIFSLMVFEGPIVTVLVGFLVAQGIFDFFLAYVVIILGDLVGDAAYYAIGRMVHHPTIVGWRNWFGLNNDRLRWIEEHYGNTKGKTLLLGKLLHGIGTAVLIGAGLARMPFAKFLLYNLIGTIPKSLILMLIGFFFGAAYEQINRYLRAGAVVGIVLFLIIIGITTFVLQFSRRKAK